MIPQWQIGPATVPVHGLFVGLGVLAVDTTLEAGKQLRNVSGHLSLLGRPAMTGYEIHLGVSRGEDLARGAVELSDGRVDGAISADDQVFATYCHGLFDHPEALTALLAWAGMTESAPVDFAARREADLDRLADSLAANLDLLRLADCFDDGAAAAALRSTVPGKLA